MPAGRRQDLQSLQTKLRDGPIELLGGTGLEQVVVREPDKPVRVPRDDLAERVRKLGARTIHSISEVARLQTIKDNNKDFMSPADMLNELMADNKAHVENMRKAHKLADDHEDSATAGLLENFIDETERRTWFLFEASRQEGGNEA